MSKYQALIDALEAGPTDGPFFVVKEDGSTYSWEIKTADGYIAATTHGFVRDEGDSRPLADFYAAANPTTIRALLADLERAEGALEQVQRILRSTPYHIDKDELFAVVYAALAQQAPSPQAPGRRKGPPGITLEPQGHEPPAAPVVSDEQIIDKIIQAGFTYYTTQRTMDEMRADIRAILALRQAVEPMTPEQMRRAAMGAMNKIPALANHHSWKGWPGTWALATAAVNGITLEPQGHEQPDVQALIEQLTAFSDPTKTTQADWDNLDWRGFCNVLQRVMMGLACDLQPAAPVVSGWSIDDHRDGSVTIETPEGRIISLHRSGGSGMESTAYSLALLALRPATMSSEFDVRNIMLDVVPGEWYEAKTREELEAFFASRIPAIREAAREQGYAIGLHGSMRRDLDLIAVPWREGASDKDVLAHAIAVAACGITRDGDHQWAVKSLGRLATSLPCCWPSWCGEAGAGHIDLSVMAPQPAPSPQPAVPVVSDEQIDAATRHIYHNGRPTTKEYRVGIVRAILALRPADHPDTLRCIKARNDLNAALHGEGASIDDLEHAVANACAKLRRQAVEPMTLEQIIHIADTRVGRPTTTYPLGCTDWINFARAVEAHHGITAKAEDAHQPTKEAEKP